MSPARIQILLAATLLRPALFAQTSDVASLSAPATATPLPPAVAPVKKPAKSQWVFSLVPKPFQKNPNLNLTVLTEMTDAGKKLRPVSRSTPSYYALHSAGYHVIGDQHNRAPIPADQVETILQRALSAEGYLPATAEHPATLFIDYFWGAHNLLDQSDPALSDEAWTANILERAALVGGEKFASELNRAITDSDVYSATDSSRVGGNSAEGTPILSAAQGVAEMNAMMNPIKLFRDKSATNDFLMGQASDDCYYVVASAFDYATVATHQKQLLWRTRMTVAAQGVSQTQTLPTLIATAAPYFGKDMAGAETFMKHAVPNGQVEIGEATVVDAAPAPSAPPKP